MAARCSSVIGTRALLVEASKAANLARGPCCCRIMGHHLAVSEALAIDSFCFTEHALLLLLMCALPARQHSLRLLLPSRVRLDLKLALLVVTG